jgi:hypothetical protein
LAASSSRPTFTPALAATDLVDWRIGDTEIATDLVNLYRALAGGWELADRAYGPNRALPKIAKDP